MKVTVSKFYNEKRLLTHSIFSVLQTLTIGVSYLLVYTLLLRVLGTQKLGIWSLVLSTTSVAGIANIGLSAGIIKFIASNSIKENPHEINSLINTSFITIASLIGIFVVIIYFFGYFILGKTLPVAAIVEARNLLPFSLFSLWINSLAGIFLSSIDGFQHSSIRSIIYIVTTIIFLIICSIFLPDFGLYAIAGAQIVQALLLLFFSYFGLKAIFQEFLFYPLKWERAIFRLIFGFSARIQLMGIIQLMYEPVTKFFLAKYGGLTFVGFYEMANRLIIQIRTIIVAANQVIVPSIARESKNKIDESYSKILNLVIFIAFPVFVSEVIFTPFISYFWIGSYHLFFMYSLFLMGLSWFINIISTPAYYSSMGLGYLTGLLLSHWVIGLCNIFFCWFLGYFIGGFGVVAGWAISLILGSTVTLFYYNNKFRRGLKSLNKRRFYEISALSLVSIFINLNLYFFGKDLIAPKILLFFTSLLYIIYLMIYIWRSEYRYIFYRLIFNKNALMN